MTDVVFFVEEPSAEDFLSAYLKRHFHDLEVRFVVFEGKSDLEKKLPRRISAWLPPKPIFFVLRDQDSGDCVDIKKRLCSIVAAAGADDTKICLVCRELESWYLGNLDVVSQAFSLGEIKKLVSKAKFRDPDRLVNAKQILIQITKRMYQERSGSRVIGTMMPKENNNSKSFAYFNRKIEELYD